jgi:hypothetical protein
MTEDGERRCRFKLKRWFELNSCLIEWRFVGDLIKMPKNSCGRGKCGRRRGQGQGKVIPSFNAIMDVVKAEYVVTKGTAKVELAESSIIMDQTVECGAVDVEAECYADLDNFDLSEFPDVDFDVSELYFEGLGILHVHAAVVSMVEKVEVHIEEGGLQEQSKIWRS